jgi:hypothetical protein
MGGCANGNSTSRIGVYRIGGGTTPGERGGWVGETTCVPAQAPPRHNAPASRAATQGRNRRAAMEMERIITPHDIDDFHAGLS